MTIQLRCKRCQHVWDSMAETEATAVTEQCPMCDERRFHANRRSFIDKMVQKDQKERMYGRRVSDRERCCENEECGMPLKGYCHREYDPGTGIATLACDNCGHEHEIEEREPSQRG